VLARIAAIKQKTCFTVGHMMNKYAVGAVSTISIDISLGFGASFNSNRADKALFPPGVNQITRPWSSLPNGDFFHGTSFALH
jgi:hypothetical protein